jgi:type IV pilus assembly protein PilF
MKIARLSTVFAGTIVLAGCVTEGVIAPEPASDLEQAEANLRLGVGYLEEERPDLAIEALLRSLDFQPRMASAHSTIAVAYDQTQEFELAEEHHRRATSLAPADSDTQNSYAVFLCRQNRWIDAEAYFDRAIAASSRLAAMQPMGNAAICATAAGDLEAAERYLRSALEIDPGNVGVLRRLIDVSLQTANYFSGRAMFQRLNATGAIQDTDLLSCYRIERGLNADSQAAECADRLRREFPNSPALSQLRELERDGD